MKDSIIDFTDQRFKSFMVFLLLLLNVKTISGPSFSKSCVKQVCCIIVIYWHKKPWDGSSYNFINTLLNLNNYIKIKTKTNMEMQLPIIHVKKWTGLELLCNLFLVNICTYCPFQEFLFWYRSSLTCNFLTITGNLTFFITVWEDTL